jgi:hypothetical protein
MRQHVHPGRARVATRPGRRLLAALLAAGLACSPTAALAWRVFVTSRGAEVRWQGEASHVILGAGWPLAGGDAAVTEVAHAALAAWREAPCGAPQRDLLGVDARARLDEADGLTSVVWIDSAEAWNSRFGATELARTLVAFRVGSGAIVDTDIAVNLGGHDFTASVACPSESFDLASTLTHELGHALGLDHSDVAPATMFPRTEAADCNLRDLDGDDLAGLCHLYPPTPGLPDGAPEPGPEPGPEMTETSGSDEVSPSDSAAEPPEVLAEGDGAETRDPRIIAYGCGAGAGGAGAARPDGAASGSLGAALLAGVLLARACMRRRRPSCPAPPRESSPAS